MKICFVTHNIFSLGGVQRVLSVIASELSKDHDVHILCNCDKFTENRELYNLSNNVKVDINGELLNKTTLSRLGTKVLRTVNSKTGILNNDYLVNILRDAYYPKSVRKKFIDYFEKNKFDLVIGVGGFYSLLIASLAKELKCKTMAWEHNSYDAYLKNKDLYFWNQDKLFEKFINDLDKHIVLTNYDRDMFKKEKLVDSIVIHNPKSFVSVEKSDLTKKQFLAAGRFTKQKGFDLLIECFDIFSKSNDDWNLVIVGEGNEKEEINNLIKKYNLEDRIRIDSFTDNIQEYFLDSSVLLLPSRWEGMPMTVIESMEMGVPVISFNITASEQIIDNNENGILVDKFNIDEFAEAMLKLSESYELRKTMGQNAIKKADEFDINIIKKQWDYILDEIEGKEI